MNDVGNVAWYTRANMEALERDGRVVLLGGKWAARNRQRIYHAANILKVKVRTHLDAERNVVGEVIRPANQMRIIGREALTARINAPKTESLVRTIRYRYPTKRVAEKQMRNARRAKR